jgi:hypothetical protein
VAGGHLDTVEEDSGAAGADMAAGKGLHGSVEEVLSAFAVEPGAGGGRGSSRRSCRAWRATGNGVRWAYRDHIRRSRSLFLWVPPPGCLGQAVCFQRVGGGACRKHLFFRNLEAKFLKTENLRGAVREAEPKRDAAAGLRTGK